jgi:hypothetical protein
MPTCDDDVVSSRQWAEFLGNTIPSLATHNDGVSHCHFFEKLEIFGNMPRDKTHVVADNKVSVIGHDDCYWRLHVSPPDLFEVENHIIEHTANVTECLGSVVFGERIKCN